MYRAMLYYLLALLAAGALVLGSPDVLLTAFVIAVIANAANLLFARLLGAKTNLESTTITALILALIAGPYEPLGNIVPILFLALVAPASKYILVWNKKHLFNPAAISVFLSALILGEGASWWTGMREIAPLIFLGGIFMVQKINRWLIIGAFLSVWILITQSAPASPVWFLMFVMLIEPLTSPEPKTHQLAYGAAVAALSAGLPVLFPSFQFSLEGSLLAGNLIFAFASPRANHVLKLAAKKKIAPRTWKFTFSGKALSFKAGQYMEWTLPHARPDSRGFRRFFTIASSPHEKRVSFITKIVENSSSFKKALLKMKKGQEVVAHGPSGDFTLPKCKEDKLAFVAGGIGITPFLSMARYLEGSGQKRNIVLVYIVSSMEDVAAKNLFASTIIHESKKEGRLTAELIKSKIPDYNERTFYLSGPTGMVKGLKETLEETGTAGIKTDYFPGY